MDEKPNQWLIDIYKKFEAKGPQWVYFFDHCIELKPYKHYECHWCNKELVKADAMIPKLVLTVLDAASSQLN